MQSVSRKVVRKRAGHGLHTRCCIFLSKQQFACELEKEKRCRAKEGGITEWMSFRRANRLLWHDVKIWVNRIICAIGESEGYAVCFAKGCQEKSRAWFAYSLLHLSIQTAIRLRIGKRKKMQSERRRNNGMDELSPRQSASKAWCEDMGKPHNMLHRRKRRICSLFRRGVSFFNDLSPLCC